MVFYSEVYPRIVESFSLRTKSKISGAILFGIKIAKIQEMIVKRDFLKDVLKKHISRNRCLSK
jgi:hypothetical protein